MHLAANLRPEENFADLDGCPGKFARPYQRLVETLSAVVREGFLGLASE